MPQRLSVYRAAMTAAHAPVSEEKNKEHDMKRILPATLLGAVLQSGLQSTVNADGQFGGEQ